MIIYAAFFQLASVGCIALACFRLKQFVSLMGFRYNSLAQVCLIAEIVMNIRISFFIMFDVLSANVVHDRSLVVHWSIFSKLSRLSILFVFVYSISVDHFGYHILLVQWTLKDSSPGRERYAK